MCKKRKRRKKEKIQKFKETRDSQHIYQNSLDKACFQQNMAYGDFKDSDNSFNIAKNPKYDGYQRGIASMVYRFF